MRVESIFGSGDIAPLINNWGTFHRGDVYFSSEEGAKRAIKEVVEPFMKDHPEFVW